jgi:hypothetical protein
MILVWGVDRAGTGSCPMADLGIIGVEPSTYFVTQLMTRKELGYLSCNAFSYVFNECSRIQKFM